MLVQTFVSLLAQLLFTTIVEVNHLTFSLLFLITRNLSVFVFVLLLGSKTEPTTLAATKSM